jgi:hypothetical protein
MTTIEAQIPEPVLHQAEELAAREHISLDEIISRAITQAIGTWSNENERELRIKRAGRERFLNALTVALNAEQPDGDRLLRAI